MRAEFFDWVRRRAGYQFPRIGRTGFKVLRECFPERLETELFPGVHVSLNLQDETHLATYWHGRRFEQPTGQILEHWCRMGGGPFFDMGANYGFYSAWMLSACPQIEAYAFEPNPATFAVLDGIRTRNQLTRLHPIPLGLGDAEAVLDLHPGGADLGQSTFAAHAGITQPPVARVRVLTFDQFCVEAGLAFPKKPAWVGKIDVEGFDLKLVRGMRRALEARAFIGLTLEIHAENLSRCGDKPEDLRKQLLDSGYEAWSPEGFPEPVPSSPCGNEFFVPRKNP